MSVAREKLSRALAMEKNMTNLPKVDPPPSGVRQPKSLKEARSRRRKALDAITDINWQLNNTNVTDKSGSRLSLEEWEEWRSRTSYKMREIHREFSYMKYWIGEARTHIRALAAGIENCQDPVAHLSTSLRLMRSVRKCGVLPKELHEKTGQVADAVESYLKREAEVA